MSRLLLLRARGALAVRFLVLLVACLVLIACSESASEDDARPDERDATDVLSDVLSPDVAEGSDAQADGGDVQSSDATDAVQPDTAGPADVEGDVSSGDIEGGDVDADTVGEDAIEEDVQAPDPDIRPEARSLAAMHDAVLRNACLGCHNLRSPVLLLNEGLRTRLLGFSAQVPTMPYITPGSTATSYLWHKVNGTQRSVGGIGARMPSSGSALSAHQLAILEAWIVAGAPE